MTQKKKWINDLKRAFSKEEVKMSKKNAHHP
jgi:hypothetical protein